MCVSEGNFASRIFEEVGKVRVVMACVWGRADEVWF
jgi:hypothetical protein